MNSAVGLNIMNKPRLVVIGNGMAGIRTLEALLAITSAHYDITVLVWSLTTISTTRRR